MNAGNPILPGYFADPAVVAHEGRYYLYATLDPWGGETLGCWSSTDFANWEYHALNWPTKAACTSADSSGAMVWAPSVIEGKDGRFYMYVSVGSEVWVGRASHPLGPWENPLGNQPLIPHDFRPGYHMIDAEAFIDDDGQAWLYWGSGINWINGKCFVVALEPDMTSFAGEVTDVTPENFFEAAVMLKREGRYYLMYSNGKTTEDTYQVHYAIGESPRGPFEEAGNSPILVTDHAKNVLSPGHHTVATVDGEPYIIYHRHSIPFDGESVLRQVCMERLEWDKAGLIHNVTPTHEGPELLQGRRPELLRHVQFSASSARSEDFRPAFAGDNNYATLWKPNPADALPWLQLDLGEERDLTSQEIRLEYPWKPYRFVLESSLDGRTWRTLKSYLETPAQGSPIRLNIPARARYLRLRFPEASASTPSPAVFEWHAG